MAFLSLLDDRERPKGSRDPLGFELVWSHFGRKLIGNLTTITSSLENFSVALLGFHWANELNQNVPNAQKVAAVRETFLRFEQLAAYLRYLSGSQEIMGINRVRQRMSSKQTEFRLGLGKDEQILSSQASYGLWGLYSSAMRDSGLVKGNERSLTPRGDEIARLLASRLDRERYVKLVISRQPLSLSQLKELHPQFMEALAYQPVQEMLFQYLMEGNNTSSVQGRLWSLTREILEGGQAISGVARFATELKERSKDDELTQRLSDMIQVERLLVALNNLFDYLRSQDGVSLDTVVDQIRSRYVYTHLPDALPASFPYRDKLQPILNALKSEQHEEALKAIISLNGDIMRQRGGAAWIELESGNVLRVRVKNEKAALRSQEQLENLWDYDYFLGSYLAIARKQLRKNHG